MSDTLRVSPIGGEADRRAFLEFPYRLYRGDRLWTPRLWPEQMAWLQREHPFFEEGEAEWFLARRSGEVVGTVGAALDHRANRHARRRWGIFGFFEFVEDPAVFAALLAQAQTWLRQRGATAMVGPLSFGGNDFPGLLVSGRDQPAALYEGHTPPYYLAFAEAAGWQRQPDNLAYRVLRRRVGEHLEFIPRKLARVAERAGRNPRFALRHADLKRFEREFEIVLDLYNRSLSTLPGFVPESAGSFRRFAEDMRPVLDEGLVIFALADGKEVGFSLALPNLAEAFHISGGLRRPWDHARMGCAMRRIRSVSFKILAVDPACWGLGLEAWMFVRIAETCLRRGYTWLDASLTGEDNPQTNRILLRLGAEEYKRYRTYRVDL